MKMRIVEEKSEHGKHLIMPRGIVMQCFTDGKGCCHPFEGWAKVEIKPPELPKMPRRPRRVTHMELI